ncbi:TonB-dependent receptor [Maribacter algicola]|uniref:TonB-dependent receptor n=1 Tax=Maribacter algicola TaxID=2498892 RepID=A0A426RGW0_9FLAO|nr:TonB-dependent receptor [Maribacter algicola]RRQ48222.1 TonB-dependent receptor [Maribacter algicola]
MYKNLVGFGAMALLCAKAIAQEGQPLGYDQREKDSVQIEELDEVVVSDSRFSLKRENSGKTVIKISAAELERNQGRTLAEVINTKSGLEINGTRSFAGQNLSVFARGGNNRQVLVIINGIQVSDPSNVNAEYDLRLLNLAQIESIEIVKGAASTLYGNSAATAVINITTKEADAEGLKLEAVSNWGTNQSQGDRTNTISEVSNNVTISGKRKGLTFLASGGHQFTDGLSAAIGEEADALSRIDGNFKVGYQFSKKLKSEASAFYTKLKSDFDNGFPVEDADFHFNSEQSRFGLATTYTYGNGSLHLNTAFNQITREFVSDFPNSFDSESFVLDVFNKYTFKERFYTIFGLNLVEGKTVFSETVSARNLDPYFNLVYISDFGLNLNAGARWNNHNEYGSHWIYNLNPSYRVKWDEGYLKFLGSYATSYIAPNLSQLYGPFGANTDLRSEENSTLEGGMEIRLSEKFRFNTVYFNRLEEGRIEYVVIDPDTFESKYQNREGTNRVEGIEVEVAATLLDNVQLNANYTFTNLDTDVALRIPKHKWNAQLAYTFNQGTYISLNYQHLSNRLDTDFNTFTDVDLAAYGLLNVTAQHRISEHVQLYASLDNLFNEDYVELLNYTTRGRNFRIGLRLRL